MKRLLIAILIVSMVQGVFAQKIEIKVLYAMQQTMKPQNL